MALPVDHLSLSSIRTLRQCPERWRRRYVERDYEPPNGPMTIGKAAGAAEAQSDHTWIESGEPLETEQVLDAFSDEWDLAATDEVDWQGQKPAALKDSGAAALKAYHRDVRPGMAAPVEAERECRVDVETEDGDEVEFLAYLDVETEDGIVIDRKVTGRKWSQGQADSDPQPSAYLMARRAEGNPARGFAFHTMVRTKTPYAEPLETDRTDDELDLFLAKIVGAADEIAWRTENDQWSYAPEGAWWCTSNGCGYWDSCPAGGLLRKRAAGAASNA